MKGWTENTNKTKLGEATQKNMMNNENPNKHLKPGARAMKHWGGNAVATWRMTNQQQTGGNKQA